MSSSGGATTIEGPVQKRGGWLELLQERWLLLDGAKAALEYYVDKSKRELRRHVPLAAAMIVNHDSADFPSKNRSEHERYVCVRAVDPGRSDGNQRVYSFRFATSVEATRWRVEITRVIERASSGSAAATAGSEAVGV